MESFGDSRRTTQKKYRMNPGTYIIKVKMDFDANYETEFDVVCAVYAENACRLSLATTAEASALAGEQVNWTGQDE